VLLYQDAGAALAACRHLDTNVLFYLYLSLRLYGS
jgi:hypothetical protein